jgi:hypothetical protein
VVAQAPKALAPSANSKEDLNAELIRGLLILAGSSRFSLASRFLWNYGELVMLISSIMVETLGWGLFAD